MYMLYTLIHIIILDEYYSKYYLLNSLLNSLLKSF